MVFGRGCGFGDGHGFGWVKLGVGGGGFCGGYWYWGEARLWWWLAVTSRGLRKMERQWERETEGE